MNDTKQPEALRRAVAAAIRLAREGDHQAADVLRAQITRIQVLEAELYRYRAALNEWLDRTQWVQKTIQSNELGKHLADVLCERIEKLQAENATLQAGYDAARLEIESLRARVGGVPAGEFPALPALFREALAWGMTYGPEIPAHQWDEMRESMVKQYADRAMRAAQPAGAQQPDGIVHTSAAQDVLEAWFEEIGIDLDADDAKRLFDKMTAASHGQAQAGAAVRQGQWTWVPVEPTTAMLVAGNHGQPGDFSARKAWQDMLDALQRSHDYTRPVDPPAPTAQQAPAQAAPAYKDSTPKLRVGDSAFESWYSTYSPAHKSDKQRARDAYAAGMGDPLVMAAPATPPVPSGWSFDIKRSDGRVWLTISTPHGASAALSAADKTGNGDDTIVAQVLDYLADSLAAPACLTCNDHGAVGNILTAEPCPDCTRKAAPAAVAGPDLHAQIMNMSPKQPTTPTEQNLKMAHALRFCDVRNAATEQNLKMAHALGFRDARHAAAELVAAAPAAVAGPSERIVAWRVTMPSMFKGRAFPGGWIDGAPSQKELEDFKTNAPQAVIELAYAAPTTQPAPAIGHMSPSKEWLENRLAIADDSDVHAGVPPKKVRPCDTPHGCNGRNCLGCDDFKQSTTQPAPKQEAPAQPTEPREWAKISAGYAHVDAMLQQADGERGGPFWHGWALREAFVAGAEWQEGRKKPAAPQPSPASQGDAQIAPADVLLRTAIAETLYQQVRIEHDNRIGPWSAFDVREQQRIVDSIQGLCSVFAPASQGDALDAARLQGIAQAIRDYHFALDTRQHGGVAQDKAFSSIVNVMGMHWVQGAEAAARAAQEGQRHD